MISNFLRQCKHECFVNRSYISQICEPQYRFDNCPSFCLRIYIVLNKMHSNNDMVLVGLVAKCAGIQQGLLAGYRQRGIDAGAKSVYKRAGRQSEAKY